MTLRRLEELLFINGGFSCGRYKLIFLKDVTTGKREVVR
jgi:hypothetical protein